MKVIEVSQHGGPDVLKVVERPVPTPGPGQVLIEVKAAGVNFADLMSREGSYPPAPKPPFVPGYEVAGIVTAIGEGVSSPAVGTRVAAFLQGFGGYTEFALVNAAQAVPLPDSIDFAASTALLVQGLTAYFLLKQAANLQSGQSVLVSAAAGGVGSLAVQIARILGAGNVYGLVSTEEKATTVRSLGASDAFNYTKTGWSEQVKTATRGQGADIFLDATGDITPDTIGALAKGGKWVLYGLQKQDAQLSADLLGSMIFGNKSLIGFSLYGITPEQIGGALQQLVPWAATGELQIIASDTFPLTQAAEAHRAIAERRTTGKVVLIP